MAFAGVNTIMPALEWIGPPGSLKLSISHGAFAVPLVVIQCLAALTRSARWHHGIDELHRPGATGRNLIALEQKLQRIRQRQHPRNALGAATAGKKTNLDFRQPEPYLVAFGGDAMMAGKSEFEAAADRGTVDRGHPRLAAGLDPAAEL